jgi:serine/threonine-protein kinase
LYDAGVDQVERPYMALEYVDGQPLDEYCDSHALSIDARLKLLLQVAEAMAFAHSRSSFTEISNPATMLVTRDGRVRLLGYSHRQADGRRSHARDGADTSLRDAR